VGSTAVRLHLCCMRAVLFTSTDWVSYELEGRLFRRHVAQHEGSSGVKMDGNLMPRGAE
jgi:hypothetical protein